MTQAPSIGRIVHYCTLGSADGVFAPEARAAIITQVHLGTANDDGVDQVNLVVLNPTGLYFNEYVAYSPDPLPGYWSWPPRV